MINNLIVRIPIINLIGKPIGLNIASSEEELDTFYCLVTSPSKNANAVLQPNEFIFLAKGFANPGYSELKFTLKISNPEDYLNLQPKLSVAQPKEHVSQVILMSEEAAFSFMHDIGVLVISSKGSEKVTINLSLSKPLLEAELVCLKKVEADSSA